MKMIPYRSVCVTMVVMIYSFRLGRLRWKLRWDWNRNIGNAIHQISQ